MDKEVKKFGFVESKSDLISINDEKLKTLILEIYEYRDKISKILEDAELLAESTKTFYDSEDGEKFRTKFNKFSVNFSTFLANIRSYGEDLEVILSRYKDVSAKNVDIFEIK